MQKDKAQAKKSIKTPDLPAELYKDQNQNIPYITSNPPPFLSTTERIVTEKNNSDPNFLRSTMYVVPSSEYTLESCAVPLAIIATPFNDRGVYNLSNGADSCKSCRSYFNCFTVNDSGSYICNICQQSNKTHLKYQENLQYSSFETSSPFLTSSAPKFKAKTKDIFDELIYPQVSLIHKPTFVFMFDLASASLVSDSLEIILSLVQNENFQLLYENVSFMVLNGGITSFSCLNGKLKVIKMVGGIPFITPNNLVKTADFKSISKIIDEIKKIRDRAAPSTRSLMESIKHISSFTIASKMAIFSSIAYDINYEDILEDVDNCCINVFSMNQEGKDVSRKSNALEKLSFYSSGAVFKYTQHELASLRADINFICLTKSVFNVRITLKVSDNLTKTSVVGSTLRDNITSCHLNHMDGNTSVMFNLSMTGASKSTKFIQLQATFTDYDGSRKMRVLNHSFPTGTPSQVFSSLSFDTLFAALVKLNIFDDKPLEKTLVDLLVYYRSKCSNNTSLSQFVLPDSIKCLPVLVQSFYKRNMLEKTRIVGFSVEQTLRYFYPRLLSLSEYAISSCLAATKNLRLSASNLTEDDIYILENSQRILIYIPRSVDRALVEKLFDVDPSGVTFIVQSDAEENAILNNIVNEVRDHYNREMGVCVCIAGESMNEAEFLMFMTEDAINNVSDYIDYIFKLHFEVQKN